jgi:tetratricopeptide (TPR) repeat protein
MRSWAIFLMAAGVTFAADVPNYNDSGELTRPVDYREWVYLTSGVGMTYGPAAQLARDIPPLFDNVFVTREAYRAFLESGKWPDKTMFVLEVRYSQSHGSINKGGSFQTGIAAFEMAIKDEQRFPEKWAYFNFPTRGGVSATSAKPLSKSAGCYACHTANGAVENTFVQFYPTLLEVAQAKHTVKASFQPWTPSPARLYHMIESGDWAKAREALEVARREDPEAAAPREATLNQLAYQLLAAKKNQEAIELLRYAQAAYPGSSNLADSLSEMLEATGQKAEALETARRALQLLDADTVTPADRKEKLAKASRDRIARLSGMN